MAERHDNNDGGAVERVTIPQAAHLLGCHPNTVRSRVKAGMYRAEKVLTENGPTWMIDRDSLTTTAPTTAQQQPVNGAPVSQQEAIQELARAIVRESGIAKDPEKEANLEVNKLRVEAAKTMVTVAAGSLVGIAAVVGFLKGQESSYLLYIALYLIFFSVALALATIGAIANRATSQIGTFARFSLQAAAPMALIVGLFVFSSYVLVNLPIPKVDMRPVKIFLLFFAGIASLMSGGVIFAIFGRQKSGRATQSEDTAN